MHVDLPHGLYYGAQRRGRCQWRGDPRPGVDYKHLSSDPQRDGGASTLNHLQHRLLAFIREPMTTSTEQLILSEIKEFRADVTAWQIASEGRLSALEYATKTGITGNGQPSRLQMVERSVEQFGRFKYWLLGFAGAISAIAHYVLPGGKH